MEKTKKIKSQKEIRLVFVIPPFFDNGATALEMQWEWEIPSVGDCLSVMYYLDDETAEKLDNQIIEDYEGISELEKQFIGESVGYVLDYYFQKVTSRTWMGREDGVLLECELVGG